MKVAFTTNGTSVEDNLEQRFGRASRFIVYDTKSDEIQVADNAMNLNAPQGAGIQAAQNLARLGVDAVVTGHCGPKAFAVLKKANIRIYLTRATTIKEAVEAMKKGNIPEASSPDVEGHWI